MSLSNLLSSNGKENAILKKWLDNNKYKSHFLKYSYKNSNFQRQNVTDKDVEILVINYNISKGN